MINLLCDRSLQEAYASRLRVVDRTMVHTAPARWAWRRPARRPLRTPTARSKELGPDASFWGGRPDSEKADQIVQRADEGAAVVLRTPAGGGTAPGKIPRRGDSPYPGCGGHRVLRSAVPPASDTGTSSGGSAGSGRSSRVQRATRSSAGGRRRIGAEHGADRWHTGAAPNAASRSRSVHARRGVNRRALRDCGGVLSDRCARGVSGRRSHGARSADPPARPGRLAAGGFRARSRPAQTPRRRSSASSVPASMARRL